MLVLTKALVGNYNFRIFLGQLLFTYYDRPASSLIALFSHKRVFLLSQEYQGLCRPIFIELTVQLICAQRCLGVLFPLHAVNSL